MILIKNVKSSLIQETRLNANFVVQNAILKNKEMRV